MKQRQREFRLLEAHYAFTSQFCNPGEGHEKGLVEGLVGWIRRNVLTPVPRVDSWDELNYLLRPRCQAYLQHQIPGRNATVAVAYQEERARLLSLPLKPRETYRVQQSRVRPDSLVRSMGRPVGDCEGLSLPRGNLGSQGEQVAEHLRCFKAGQTVYNLAHYLDVLERKPRAVCQAKPVRAIVATGIRAVRDLLPQGSAGDREFVQILRLLLEYGQSALLDALEVCQAHGGVSYETIRFELLKRLQDLPAAETAASEEWGTSGPTVAPTDLRVYDELLKAGEAR